MANEQGNTMTTPLGSLIKAEFEKARAGQQTGGSGTPSQQLPSTGGSTPLGERKITDIILGRESIEPRPSPQKTYPTESWQSGLQKIFDYTQDGTYNYDQTSTYLDEARENLRQLQEAATGGAFDAAASSWYKTMEDGYGTAIEYLTERKNLENAQRRETTEGDLQKAKDDLSNLNLAHAQSYDWTKEDREALEAQIEEQQGVVDALQLQLDSYGYNTSDRLEELEQQYSDLRETVRWNPQRREELADLMEATRQALNEENERLHNGARDYNWDDRLASMTDSALKGVGSSLAGFGDVMLRGLNESARYEAAHPDVGILGERTGPNAIQEGREDYYSRNAERFAERNVMDTGADRLQEIADRLGESAAADLERAKKDAGTFGEFAVDAGTNLIQMGFDVGIGAMTGGSSLVPMFMRTFGDSARQARLEGADLNQQLAYGVTKATIEVGTEKIFDGLAGAFGKGAADDMIEGLIGKLTESDLGRNLLRAVAGSAGEGTEEMLSDFFGAFADLIYKDETLREAFNNNMEGVTYDFLVGAALGGLGSVTGWVNGEYAEKNSEFRLRQLAEEMNVNPDVLREILQRAEEEGALTLGEAEEAPAPEAQEERETGDQDSEEEETQPEASQPEQEEKGRDRSETPAAQPKLLTENESKAEATERAAKANAPLSQETAAAARRETAEQLKSEGTKMTSASALGIRMNGDMTRVQTARTETLTVLPENTWDTEMQLVSAWAREATGLPVTFVQGDAYLFDDSKRTGQSTPLSAAYTADGIVIRADSDSRTVTQIFEDDILTPLRRGGNSNGEVTQKQGLLGEKAAQQAKGKQAERTGENGKESPGETGTRTAEGTEAERSGSGEAADGGDGGRSDRGRAGEQAEGVGPAAGERGRRSVRRRDTTAEQSIGDAIRRSGGEVLSARELGLASGTETKSLVVIPETYQTAEMRQAAENIAYNTGCEVTLVQGQILIEVPGRELPVSVNGFYDPAGNRIVIRTDSRYYTVGQIGAHEEFHALAARDPELVERVRDKILERYGEEDLRRIVAGYIRMRRGLHNADGDVSALDAEANEILEEIFADAHGDMNAFGLGANRFLDVVEETTDERWEQQEEGGSRQTRGPPKYTYAGGSARGADLRAGEIADRMEANGVDAETIRKETGWFRGMDGQWRFELDDSGAMYRRTGDASYRRNHPEYSEYRDLELKLLYGELTQEETERLAALNRIWKSEPGRLSNLVTSGNATLDMILDHEQLYEAYPQLRNVHIAFEDIGKGGGSYNPATDTITLDRGLRNKDGEAKSVLLHEIQHAIQEIEGFTPGASTEYWTRRNYETDREASERIEDLRQSAKEIRDEIDRVRERAGYDEFAEETYQAAENGEISWEEADERIDEFEKNNKSLNSLNKALDDVMNEIRNAREKIRSPWDLYQNTAGEIEARDVMDRRNLGAFARRMFAPKLGDEKTVFADGLITALSENSSESETIKKQLKAVEAKLNKMEPVFRADNIRAMNTHDTYLWAAEEFRKSGGYLIDRKGFGVISAEPEFINLALNYANTASERAAIIAVPSVLKRGIEAREPTEHKDRRHNTVTFAGPVELNGARGNMAVVVKMTKGNRLKAYRIMTPDGKTFQLNFGEKETEPTPVRGAAVSSPHAKPISSGSEANVPQSGSESKDYFSSPEYKARQYEIIRDSNPATDDVHTWIRSAEDILSFSEAIHDSEYEGEDFSPDYTRAMAEKAEQTGRVTVYSSNRIRPGTWVTPSYQEAKNYAGSGKVHSMSVPVEQVAWVDMGQGQYTGQVGTQKYSISDEDYQMTLDDVSEGEMSKSQMHPSVRARVEEAEQLTKDLQEYFRGVDPESDQYMSPEEIEAATELNLHNRSLRSDMEDANAIMLNLSEISRNQTGQQLQETYEMMERILQHLDSVARQQWASRENTDESFYSVLDSDFSEWYNKKHPSIYYPEYTPGDLFKSRRNEAKEKAYLRQLLNNDMLVEPELSQAREFLNRLESEQEIFYSVEEEEEAYLNLFGDEFDEEEYSRRGTEEEEEETPRSELRPEEGRIDGATYGDEDVTYVNDTEEVPFRWAVVPLKSLVISNEPDGSINPAYPKELQPRDRTRADSLRQTQNMARNLIPKKLEDSADIQNGAPVIRGDGVVVSGNGRSMSLTLAYENGLAESYVDYIRKKAKKWGIDPEQIPENPVLVRVAQGDLDWEALARDANVSTIAGKSASEQAKIDAKNLMRHPDILGKLIPNEDGNLNSSENQDFINDFLHAVIPEAEQAAARTRDGLLTQDGLQRAEYAIFEAAYGDTSLLEKLSESLDNDMKNVTNALLAVAPQVVATENMVEQGELYDTQVRQHLLDAVRLYADAKAQGKSVAELTSNYTMGEEADDRDVYIARMVEESKRSGKKIRIFLQGMYDTVEEFGDPNQIGFFSEEETGVHEFTEVLEGAIRKYERIRQEEAGREERLPNRERWGKGTLEEINEIRNLSSGERYDYYRAEERNEAADGGSSPELSEETGPADTGNPERDGESGSGEPGGGRGELNPDGLTLGSAEAPDVTAPAEGSGAERRLNERRDARKKAEKAKKRKPVRTQFPANMSENTADIVRRIHEDAAAARAERMKYTTKAEFNGTKALEKIGVKVENSIGNYAMVDQLRNNEKSAFQVKKLVRQLEKKLRATPKEKSIAHAIADGELDIEDVKDAPGKSKSKIETLAEYYGYENSVNNDMILQRRRDINLTLDEKMENLLQEDGSFTAKLPKMVVMNYRTPERLCRTIFGEEKGKEIYQEIFHPVSVNEAERIRWINHMFDEVRTFEGADGKSSELTRDEAALVQQVIEGVAAGELVAGMELEDGRRAIESAAENILNGADPDDSAREWGLDEEDRGIAEQYARWLQTKAILDSGDFDTVKINNAVKKYQEMYDNLYDAANDFLVAHGYKPIGFIKGYAPHMQMEQDLNVFAGYLERLGFNADVTRLPTSIAGLTSEFKPNKRWNPYFLSRRGDMTDYDIAKGFQSYIGYMSDVLFHTDDVMRIRAMSRYYRQTYAPEEIQNKLSWAKNARRMPTDVKEEMMNDNGINTNGMSQDEIEQKLDDFVAELFQDIQEDTKFSDYVMYLDNYANILAGKQSSADRSVESILGRETLNFGNRLVAAFQRTQVAGNLSSALNQTAQWPIIQAELGKKYALQAIRDFKFGELRKGAWAQESDFLTGKRGTNALVTDAFDMMIEKMFTPLEFVDGMMSTIAVRGMYLKQVEAGKSHEEAMKEADAFGKRVMGSRDKGSRPTAFHSKNPVMQMLNVFQVEALNSWEHLSQDLPAEFREIEKSRGKKAAAGALAKVIISALMSAFLLNRLGEEVYGGTPAPFDLLGLTANFIASGQGLTTNQFLKTVIDNATEQFWDERLFDTDREARREEFSWADALEDSTYNISNDIPFIRNFAALMGLGDQTLPLPLMGAGKDLKYLWNDITSDIKNGRLSGQTGIDLLRLMNQVVPGGRQLTKTAEGLQTMVQGGRYLNGKLYYPVENNIGNWAKALLFGRSSLGASDEFYAGDDRALSVGATELYQMLTEDGADRREAYEALQQGKSLTDRQEAFLRGYAEGGGDSFELYESMQDYKAIASSNEIGSYERGKAQREVITNADLTDQQRLGMYRAMDGNNAGKADKIEAMMKTGLSWRDAVKAYDAYARIEDDDNLSNRGKAEEWAAWVEHQGYGSTQKGAVRDNLKFWQSTPIEETTVDKFADSGMSADDSEKLAKIIQDLKPEPGRSSVTDLQKYTAITTSGLSETKQWAAIAAMTPESYSSTHDKISVMRNNGIKPTTWVQSKQAMYDADSNANGNGTIDQKEARAALSGMKIPDEEKAILWQLTNKSWSWKKNPFDKTIGRDICDQLQSGNLNGSDNTGSTNALEKFLQDNGLTLGGW